MDSAKDVAREMLAVINVDKMGILVAYAKGFVRLPYSLAYLGYDYLDTDNRSRNLSDRIRFTGLVKRNVFNADSFEKAVRVFIDRFIKKMNATQILEKIVEGISGIAGSVSLTLLTGVHLGRAIVSGIVSAALASATVGLILYIGAEESRAIYTSRELKDRNPYFYDELRTSGDLDLLYFLIQDWVYPYEQACLIAETEPEKFKKICEYFLKGLSDES